MTPECRAVRRALLLGEASSSAVAEHIRSCAACQAFDTAERAVADLASRKVHRPAAPHSLRERLVATLEAERRRSARGARRRTVRVLILAAAGLAAVAVPAWVVRARGAAEARHTVEALASDHIELLSRGGPVEFASSSPGETARWLRNETRLAVQVPDLPRASLRGARRCELRGRQAALVFYELDRRPGEPGGEASLFVFKNAGERWSAMEPVPGGSKRLCRSHDRGLSVLVWEDRGLTYALVSDLAEPELLSVARQL